MRIPPCLERRYFLGKSSEREDDMNENDALNTFVDGARSVWSALSSELVSACHGRVEQLLRARTTEPWLAPLRREMPDSRELHRDPDHGFVLLAHAETQGRYRSPHDHGRGWVIYGVQQGEMEVGTYIRVQDSDGRVRLVRRDVTRLRAGDARVYLPGDIHDTRCTAESVLYFRFTERDLKKEEREGHVTRYVERNGIWTLDVAS
jgi:hypothetical protein